MNETDHDLLIRHDALLTTVISEVKENAKASISRDAELRAQLERVLESCGVMQQGIAEIKQTQRTDEADRVQMRERLNLLWNERTPTEARQQFVERHGVMWQAHVLTHTPEERERRARQDKEHDTLWSAYNIFRFLSWVFVIEQPVIIGALGILLTR